MNFDSSLVGGVDPGEAFERSTAGSGRQAFPSRPAAAPDSSPEHARWMGEAISLARAMQGWVWPNPAVGCVIVRDNEIVGRGQTQFGGRPHAERVALDDAGAKAEGASLYVTLEPCCHWGKTPPCADAIITAGVRRVFAGLQDPDPRVNGGGFRKLRDAGIDVAVGLGADEALEIMAGFFHRIATGTPLVKAGRRPDPRSPIPTGFDAALRWDEGHTWLVTRLADGAFRSEPILPWKSSRGLLVDLGDRGLTSVYVVEDDPIAGLFAGS